VELAVDVELLHDLAAVGLETTVVIVKAHPCRSAHGGVPDAARQHFVPRVVAPALPSAHQVAAAIQGLQEAGDLRRVILEIGVHRDDDFPAGSPEARIEGRGLAEVPAEADPANPPVGLSLSADRLPSAVRAPVVDEDDLDIQFLGVGDGRDLPAELREAGLFVLGWDHKADQGADSGGRSRRFHASTHP